jgi:hypothetical protein
VLSWIKETLVDELLEDHLFLQKESFRDHVVVDPATEGVLALQQPEETDLIEE